MGSSLSKSHLPRNYWPEETGQVKARSELCQSVGADVAPQQAIQIVEGKVSREHAGSDGTPVGDVLDVLATNYRPATR
jgi:hypothetical protein